MHGTRRKGSPPRARRDWGRLAVRVLCVVFALIGAIPLAVGFLVRTATVRAWASAETAALLESKLGITARYDVRVQAWPLMVGLNRLVVDSSDGGAPFLELERVAIRPRLFSLLAGRIDAGDVEIIGPRVRAVVKDGELRNFKLPDTGKSSGGGGLDRAPLSSVAITDARVDLTIDSVRVQAREVDVDVSAEPSSVFEIAMRSGFVSVVHTHPAPGREAEEDSVDEDVICRFDTRISVEPGRALVRRLILEGAADFDPDPGTAPPCGLQGGDWRRVELELGALRAVGLGGGMPHRIEGRVRARLPVPIVHRFVDLPPATGSVAIDVDAEYDAAAAPLGLALPRVKGTLALDQPGLDGRVFVTRLSGKLSTTPDAVQLSDTDVAWADGTLKISSAEVKPFEKGVPLHAGPIDLANIELPGLLRDLGVHPQAHVAWTLREGRFDRFGGTLVPLSLEGPLAVQTRGFDIFDRPTKDPARQRLMGVKEGSVRGSFQVRPNAVVLSGFSIDTPSSHLRTTVSLGFNDQLGVEVHPGSRVDLAEVSPLADLELAGVASMSASMHGSYAHPKLKGEVGIEKFVFAGFPIGDLEPSPVAFEPLALTLENARVRHGASRMRVPSLKVDFDPAGNLPKGLPLDSSRGIVVVDATVDTREAPHLAARDLLEMLRLEKDPRYVAYKATASGTARAHFALGGPEDRCGGGYLAVSAGMRLSGIELLEERFDEGEVDVNLIWDDQAAGGDGMRLDVRSASLRKGTGSVLASVSIAHGGALKGSVIASGLPLTRIDALGPAGSLFDGSVSLVASLGGTVSRMAGFADVHVSRIGIRRSHASLPPSRVELTIVPLDKPPRVVGRTPICGNPIGAPFDPAEFERDLPDGSFVANGSLFGGQVALEGVRVTRQQRKIVDGRVRMDALDLGTLANLIPGVAFSAATPKGTLTASLDIERLPLADPKQAALTLKVDALKLEREGQGVHLTAPSGPIRLAGNALTVPELHMEAHTASRLSAAFTASGEVKRVFTAPELDVGIRVSPTKLARLSADIPQIRHARGTVQADVRITGPLQGLRYAGSATLKEGELDVVGLPVSLDDIDVEIAIDDDLVRLTRATARVGTGTVSAVGNMPVRGLNLGMATASIVATGVKLPVADGVNLTANANLVARFQPGVEDDASGEKNLPHVEGRITLTSFNYTRPILMSMDLGDLTGRQRTTVQTYDPAADAVRFNVVVLSPNPLHFSNDLADMRLEVSPTGLELSGTNQRFGARGSLRILPDSKLMLRSTEFNVREGYVRFDDPFRIAPKVDVRAESEYRRYTSMSSSAADPAAGAEAPTAASAGIGAGANASGHWRIKLHAQGDADNLQLNLTSDPPLSQEDIVLLLTLGMTRAELNQGVVSSLGETVGLEALSSLTGADKAVKTIVPIIDEFRFGTGYSSKNGAPEPTVTLGKRITDAVRANVTTGLSQGSQVRAGVEVKLSDRMSVQGSYDNANDASSSPVGNLGADLRWRLEFE
ncbi:translocation/assembly module TamB domain-containing protein [Sorangium cellulosum]|uniref:translocation/assembly module TamB domain-containing protein n=1 Tax=Sorangium cellulosum TaxID=56 RepID=UPI0007C4A6F6|nr:translocation/assembly module TamB domain-containing protein [Sorangium cellulosum]